MTTLEYNNFLGSGWVEWEDYKVKYAEIHGSSDFIKDFPETRSHMFRVVDEDGYVLQDNNIVKVTALMNTILNTMKTKKQNPMTFSSWDDSDIYLEIKKNRASFNCPYPFSYYKIHIEHTDAGGCGMGEYPAEFKVYILANI